MTTLNDFAPYPRRVEDVTAESLVKALAVRAHARQRLVHEMDFGSTEQSRRAYAMTIGTIVSEYGVVELLTRLSRLDPEAADAAARDLWGDWEDGQAVAVGLWQYVAAYGIDPEQVSRVAEKRRAEHAAKNAETEQATAGQEATR